MDEGNRLIHDFLGYVDTPYSDRGYPQKTDFDNMTDLVEALDKINEMGHPYLISHGDVSIYESVKTGKLICHEQDKKTVVAAFKCVTKFIKKYNGKEIHPNRNN